MKQYKVANEFSEIAEVKISLSMSNRTLLKADLICAQATTKM